MLFNLISIILMLTCIILVVVISFAKKCTTCAGKCTRVNSDVNNCGKCNNVCPDGDVCTSGICTSK